MYAHSLFTNDTFDKKLFTDLSNVRYSWNSFFSHVAKKDLMIKFPRAGVTKFLYIFYTREGIKKLKRNLIETGSFDFFDTINSNFTCYSVKSIFSKFCDIEL